MGYIGKREALPFLVQGLKRLEYRGYDSAGLVVRGKDHCRRIRSVGKIVNLENKIRGMNIPGALGIAHTRWATHGGVSEANTHPHSDCSQSVYVVHNGIIENYRELKAELKSHAFTSETDSEVLAHLIEQAYQGDLRDAVEKTLRKVRGTYGLAVMHAQHPSIIVGRMGSPLVIGLGDDEYLIASDPTPLLPYTKKVVFLNDGEIGEIRHDGFQVFGLDSNKLQHSVFEIPWDEEQAQKQGFDHFMIKEIHDQPTVFLDAIRGRAYKEEGRAVLGGLNMNDDEMRSIRRIILVACGTAYHAGMIGKYLFESIAGIPVEVDVASEFRYRHPVLDQSVLVFAISQSGETADTLAAIREAKRKGAFVRGIVNVVGSTIARETDGGTYIHAGPELAVASTKAYTNMIAILTLYALQFGRSRHYSVNDGAKIIEAMFELPLKMKKIFKQVDEIQRIAHKYMNVSNFLFLGRGLNYPVALEGSLKLKEISYIHSEAYAAGEMKHGANALLCEDFPVMALLTRNSLYEKMRTNVEEVRARKSPIILVATEGDEGVSDLTSDVIFVPPTLELLEPLLNTIPLQIFAYSVATGLGRDVDRPRNLAKSVTVE